jgi:hypothetical protein
VETIPVDLEAQGKLPALSYTGPLEALAERFHMTEEALQALNPNVDFRSAGQKVLVANVGNPGLPRAVQLIEVDKAEKAVRSTAPTASCWPSIRPPSAARPCPRRAAT